MIDSSVKMIDSEGFNARWIYNYVAKVIYLDTVPYTA